MVSSDSSRFNYYDNFDRTLFPVFVKKQQSKTAQRESAPYFCIHYVNSFNFQGNNTDIILTFGFHIVPECLAVIIVESFLNSFVHKVHFSLFEFSFT